MIAVEPARMAREALDVLRSAKRRHDREVRWADSSPALYDPIAAIDRSR